MTLTLQTMMMLMLYLLLMLKLMKNLLAKSENAEDKQIWVSASVCVVIFMHVKTRRQLLVSLKFNPNKYVSIWHRRKCCQIISLIRRNILKMCVLRGLMELM